MPLGCQQISLGASTRVTGKQKQGKKNGMFRHFFLDFMKSIFRISRISGFHWSSRWPMGSNYLVRGTLCQKMGQIGWKMAKRQPKMYRKFKNSEKQLKYENWASRLKFGPNELKIAPKWSIWVRLMGWMHLNSFLTTTKNRWKTIGWIVPVVNFRWMSWRRTRRWTGASIMRKPSSWSTGPAARSQALGCHWICQNK